jgi:hypothetical protein
MKAAPGGRAGVRRAIPGALAVIAALALTGCETTAQKSAQLERAAHHTRLAERGLSIVKQSTDVRVLGAALVHGAEGAAAVVTLRNDSAHALTDVPIAITVKNAGGSTVFQNNAPGLEAALTAIGSLPAHGEATWVDDQVPASGAPASVSAIVGESPIAAAAIAGKSPVASGPIPRIEVAGVHRGEEAGSTVAAGTARNRSNVTQKSLVVYALARRAGRIVAAGRAILPEVPAGASTPFQAFLVGSAQGAALEASAPATTLG